MIWAVVLLALAAGASELRASSSLESTPLPVVTIEGTLDPQRGEGRILIVREREPDDATHADVERTLRENHASGELGYRLSFRSAAGEEIAAQPVHAVPSAHGRLSFSATTNLTPGTIRIDLTYRSAIDTDRVVASFRCSQRRLRPCACGSSTAAVGSPGTELEFAL